MFDDIEEIGFDDNRNISQTRQKVPESVQNGINTIVNKEKASLVKDDTKEMIKGGVLGAVIGAIICLYRRKSVWLGVLAGGLAGGYLTKEGIVDLSKKEKGNSTEETKE
jgi:uncharacterized protein YcfJ